GGGSPAGRVVARAVFDFRPGPNRDRCHRTDQRRICLPMNDISRLAINQATTKLQWNLRQAVEGYARQGVRRIGIWRDRLEECGLSEAKRLLRDHGMTVTGLNRAGPLFGLGTELKPSTPDDDRRAIE